MKSADGDLRCFCSRSPLLAKYGIGEDGKLYVHLKVYKQNRIYAEVHFKQGLVTIRCRECLRWHSVLICDTTYPKLEEVDTPLPG